MKRLIYCLDGTWNKYDADYPTNVVIFHKTIAKTDPNGNQQIAYYDKGVGTALGEKILGGTLGSVDNQDSHGVRKVIQAFF